MHERDSLPRSLSLKSRAEISGLLKKGRRLPGDYFTLVWQPADKFGYAILLSKGQASAVERNRVKRLYREAIRLSRARLKRNLRIAVFPQPTKKEPKSEQIRNDVCRAFEKLSAEI